MKIGLRILLGYFLVVGLAAWFVMNVFVEQVKPGVRATLEDTLVDTANLLAVMVADEVRQGASSSALLERMHAFAQRGVSAKISGVDKGKLDYRVYITDASGIVRFDSDNKAVGQDYSRWNDVYLTLQGHYGARTTRDLPDDDASAVMHVAAPVMDGDKIIGVLTVAKPVSTVQPFVERSQAKILRRGVVLLAASLLIGVSFALWLALALRKLTCYAADVEAGKKAALPALGENEIGTLGRALDAMRRKLEGKQYAEELMHTLAHELKSPIAAIQGSAELMREALPPQERERFLDNILAQNARQKQLIDRLLALVRVEKQQQLDAVEQLDAQALAQQAASDIADKALARGVRVAVDAAACPLRGDALLLRQALGNLLDNAVDFAPRGSQVDLAVHGEGDHAVFSVRDHGPGIPDFAQPRLFERFYSLPRPDSAKSTGLGLPFVREVAALHGGSVAIDNADGGGVVAVLRIPA